MSDTFTISTDVLKTATAAFEGGEETFKAYCLVAPTILGCTEEQFRGAFTVARRKAEEDSSFETLTKATEGYTVPKGLLKVLLKGDEHISAFTLAEEKDEDDKVTQEAYAPRLTFTVELVPAEDEDGEATGLLKVSRGRAVSGRKSTGEKSSKSRISAFNAWKRGAKQGDTFKVEKTDKGYKVDGRPVPKKKNGGLSGFILKVHPDSKTADILRSYGASAD